MATAQENQAGSMGQDRPGPRLQAKTMLPQSCTDMASEPHWCHQRQDKHLAVIGVPLLSMPANIYWPSLHHPLTFKRMRKVRRET